MIAALGCEQQGCSVAAGCGDSASSCRSLETSGSCVGSGGASGGGGNASGAIGQGQGQQTSHIGPPPVSYQTRRHSTSPCYTSCCAESAKKVVTPISSSRCYNSKI